MSLPEVPGPDLPKRVFSLPGDNPLKRFLHAGSPERPARTGPVQVDSTPEVEELERRYLALELVRNYYYQPGTSALERALACLYSPFQTVDEIGNQFALRIMPAFLAADPEDGLAQLRRVVPNTLTEETVLLITDEQFRNLHQHIAEVIASQATMIAAVAKHRVDTEFPRIDRMQFSGAIDRSIDTMRKKGLSFRVSEQGQAAIERNRYRYNEAGPIPWIEILKNERVLEIEGFNESKVSHVVHDIADHVWTFDLCDRLGLFDKYSELFQSIGSPHATDIFKREGECVASLAFGVRYFDTRESGFGPLFRTSQIETYLEKLFVERQLLDRHLDAYRIVKSSWRGNREWQSLGFVLSTYLAELDEQRRKFGKIKQKDLSSGKIVGELDPLCPDYVCFLIECHHALLDPRNDHANTLLRVHLLVEEYLHLYAMDQRDSKEFLNIQIDELRQVDFRRTALNPWRVHWMRNNSGFTTTREGVV